MFKLVPGLWKGKRPPFVRTRVVRSTDFRGDALLAYENVAELDVEERQLSTRRLASQDIVVERSGGGPKQPVGRVALFEEHEGIYACSNFTTALRVVDRVRANPRFVALYLHYLYRCGATETLQNATTGIRNLAWSEYLKLEVSLPPLIEQTAIADLLTFSQKTYDIEQDLLGLSLELKQTAMRELFTRGLRAEALSAEREFGRSPASWRPAALSDVAVVQTGAAKGRKFGDAEVVEVAYLRVANVQDGHLDLRNMKQLRIRRSEIERYRLRDGDVVLTEGGDFDKLGRGFIWRSELPLCIHQNHVFAVRTNRDVLLPDFFAYLAQSHYGKAYFLQVAHKTTNLASINSTKLKAFPVLLPDLAEQREIVDILDAIDQKVDIHKKKRAVLEDLFKSLLHRLMTGEIRVSDLNLSALDQSPAAAVSA